MISLSRRTRITRLIRPTRSVRLLATLLAFALPHAALAIPIDCTKAVTQKERAICGDPFLLQTDARLDTLYDITTRLVSPTDRTSLIDSQRAWVKEREQCATDKNCMRAACARRASIFEAILKRAEARGPF